MQQKHSLIRRVEKAYADFTCLSIVVPRTVCVVWSVSGQWLARRAGHYQSDVGQTATAAAAAAATNVFAL